MTRRPRVSVLLPAGGSGEWLHDAVQSVLAQDFEDFELLLLVKPSRLELLDPLDSLTRDPRLLVFPDGPEAYIDRLNYGLERARGEYIARMDADDLSRPDRLQRQVTRLDETPELSVVGSYVSSNIESDYLDWQNSFHSADDVRRGAWIDIPVVHPTWLVRRPCFERSGGYRDGPFPEDYEILMRWLLAGERIEKIQEPLVFWRRHEGCMTVSDPRFSDAAMNGLKARCLLADGRVRGRGLGIVSAGANAKRISRALAELGVETQAFFDVDPRKIGGRVRGRVPVLDHERLDGDEHRELFLLVAKGGLEDRARIRALFEASGRSEGDDYLFVR